MSIQSETALECAWCDGPREPEASVRGSFCSRACWLRHKGDRALNVVRHDHRFCVSCGRQLKTIEEPTDETLRQIEGAESTRALVGYQYRTPAADIGEISNEGAHQHSEITRMGTVCSCGVTDQREASPALREVELADVLANLFKVLYRLWDEGAIDRQPDSDAYFDGYEQERDFTYAVGRALYG